MYTYVISYKGATHVTQGTHSNFKGFTSTGAIFLLGSLHALTPALRRDLAEKAYRGEFPAIENIKHAWRTSIELGGNEFVVVAVQTKV
jgi:hypothetical protein